MPDATHANIERATSLYGRPLIVVLSGTAGVGKSTLATMLAHRLGITRVIATDAVREVIRAFFSPEFMPAVHCSSFEAGEAKHGLGSGGGDGDLLGFLAQVGAVETGLAAVISRACREQTAMVLEGVHAVPGLLEDELRAQCTLVEATLVIDDPERHRSHFERRGPGRPADRYLARFEQIRKLQDYLVDRATALGVPIVGNADLDRSLARVLELTVDTVARTRAGMARLAEDRPAAAAAR